MDAGKRCLLPRKVYESVFHIAFEETSQVFPNVLPGKFLSAKQHKQVAIGGKVFTTKNQSRRNAEIVFQHTGSSPLIPGVVVGIFSIEDGKEKVFVLSIQVRKPVPDSIPNPFARYPDFGAEIWSTEFESEMVCIAATQPIYHVQSRLWVKGAVVLKPIQSVGLPYI